MDYTELSVTELRNIAKEKKIKGYSALKKQELIEALAGEEKPQKVVETVAAGTEEAAKKKAPESEEPKTGKENDGATAVKKPAARKTGAKKAEESGEEIRPAKSERIERRPVSEQRPMGERPMQRPIPEARSYDGRPMQRPNGDQRPGARPASEARSYDGRPMQRPNGDQRPGVRPSSDTRSYDGRPMQRPMQGEQRPMQRQPQGSYSVDGRQQGSYSVDGRQPGSYSADGRQPGSYSADGRQPGSYSADGRQPGSYSADGRQQGSYSADGRQPGSYTAEPSEESFFPTASSIPAATDGKIFTSKRITSEEREALDPTLSPDIEALDSGEAKAGILEVMADGFGFIRCDNFLPGENDVYVSPAQIRKFNLKTGDIVVGNTKVRSASEKFSALLYVKTVNGIHPAEAAKRPRFEDLTPVFPNERLHLETPGCEPAMRIVDLLSPIGKGQRGMIVSQPKAGKTTLLKQIARALTTNHPDLHLIILLIDERPEEVTDMQESISGKNVEVIYSTFDELPDRHKRVSEMVIERAKRLVEHKKDVVILLDSITRLARAYNLTCVASGRTLSGGLDPAALYMPKKFFGAARCMREGGSLTVLATALVETGSRMDDVVFEEFKGTGNMELVLDRNLSERRIFPAIDLPRSGTRRDDLLLTPSESEANTIIRRAFNSAKSDEAVERIINLFARTRSNAEFCEIVKKTKLV